jgi:hypothetical protein
MNSQSKELDDDFSKTLREIISNKTTKKNLELSWIKLKRTFSPEELDAILNRVHKARERSVNAVTKRSR